MLGESDPTRMVLVSSNINIKDHQYLASFIRSNMDVFAWLASDILGIDLEVIIQHLNMDSEHHPAKQKKNFTLEHQKTIEEEVDKLLFGR